MLKRVKRLYDLLDGFVLVMLCAVVLALLAPQLGVGDGPLHLNVLTAAGVSVVFFLHGASLSLERLVDGVRNWRLHVFVQAFTYLVFPAIGIAAFFGLKSLMPQELLLGLFYLCALPSTVSSSVAMTAAARGNVPGAIFNATLSGLAGMVLTPLLLGLVMHAQGEGMALGDSILNIGKQLLLPFALGQLARPLIAGFLGRHKAVTSKLDRAVIVLIVYQSFCEATAAGMWGRYGNAMIVVVILLSAALLAVVLSCTTWTARRLGFSKEDEITAVFCGSKKSLAYGIPMARIFFLGNPALGLIVLPIMVYHQVQLIVCSIMAGRYAARTTVSAP